MRRASSTAIESRITGPPGGSRGSQPLLVEDELRRPDRHAVAVRELRPLRAAAVHLEAIRRAEVDDREPVALSAQLGVPPRGVGVGDLDVALARATDHGPLAVDLVRPTADGDPRLRLLDAELDRRGGLGRDRRALLPVDHRLPGGGRGRRVGLALATSRLDDAGRDPELADGEVAV